MKELRPDQATLILNCQDAVIRFFRALDSGDFAAVAVGMAREGIWERQGKRLRGPTEVLAALKERPTGRVTAHLVLNLVVDLTDETQARAQYAMLAYRHQRAPGEGDGHVPLDRPVAILDFDDRMTLEDGTWRVLHRASRRVFAA